MAHAQDDDIVAIGPVNDQVRLVGMDADGRGDLGALAGGARVIGEECEGAFEAAKIEFGLGGADSRAPPIRSWVRSSSALRESL